MRDVEELIEPAANRSKGQEDEQCHRNSRDQPASLPRRTNPAFKATVRTLGVCLYAYDACMHTVSAICGIDRQRHALTDKQVDDLRAAEMNPKHPQSHSGRDSVHEVELWYRVRMCA